MNTGNKYPHIPTYSKVRGKYNGQAITGIYKDGPQRLCLDSQGAIKWEMIQEPVVVYDVGRPVENTTADGTSGILPLSNGLDIHYGPYTQYKTKREAMAFAEAVCELCTGIDISMKETGRAMDNDGWISVEERLPETLENVLVFNTESAILIAKRYINGWVAYFADGERNMGELAPIYWKPLPEPPKYN